MQNPFARACATDRRRRSKNSQLRRGEICNSTRPPRRLIGVIVGFLIGSAMAFPLTAYAQAGTSARVGQRHVFLAEQKAGASLRPNEMSGQTACAGYTLDNYSQRFKDARTNGKEGAAAYCSLAFISYDTYLRAIATDQPKAKVEEAYAVHRRDVDNARRYFSSIEAVPPSQGDGHRRPKLDSGRGYGAVCGPKPAQQTTNVEFSAKSKQSARQDAIEAIDKRVRALCGSRPPAAEPKYQCKVVNAMFGDYVCKTLYTCSASVPACVPTNR